MEKKLTRDPQDKMIAGVATGIAKYFDLDVTFVRIAFALATFFGGSGFLIYCILWIVVSEESKPPYTYTDYRTVTDEPIKAPINKKNNSSMSLISGCILIVMGAYFLLDEFDILPDWLELHKLWPLAFVALGLILLSKAKKSSDEAKTNKDGATEDEFKSTDEENYNQ